MQGDAHAERIREMGAPAERVRVTGNLKFDAVEAGRQSDRLARLLRGGLSRGRPLWVAGGPGGGGEHGEGRGGAGAAALPPRAAAGAGGGAPHPPPPSRALRGGGAARRGR